MKLTLFRANLKTAGKTAEQIKALYDGPKPDDKECESWIKVLNDLDGMEVLVLESFTGNDYYLASWNKDNDEKIMEFVYLAEQDPFFGTYIDEHEEFIKDWKSGEYETAGSLVIAKADVQIIEELPGIDTKE